MAWAWELALFTAVEGRVVEEGTGGAAPLSALILLLVGSRLPHATSHIYDGGQKTRFHAEHAHVALTGAPLGPSPDRAPLLAHPGAAAPQLSLINRAAEGVLAPSSCTYGSSARRSSSR